MDRINPNRTILVFLICFWVSTLSFGIDSAEAESKRSFEFKQSNFKCEFGGGLGYRTDDLDWSISGDISGRNPNILSELEWKDVGIFQVKGSNTTVYRGLRFKGHVAYGWILAGDNQDSDFLGDDRTIEFSRSNNDAGDGSTLDASAGIGYLFSPASEFVSVSPMIGYSLHRQNLVLTDGNQTVTSPIAPPLGLFDRLDSSYDAEWKGPWVGVDLIFQSPPRQLPKVADRYELTLGFEYHWTDYRAEADWNLRTDFAHPKSFEQDADGDGIVLSAGLRMFFDPKWALGLSGGYQNWETGSGTDRTFFSNGTTGQTRLNEVTWTSYAVMFGSTYSF